MRTIHKQLNTTTEIFHTELGEIETAVGQGGLTGVTTIASVTIKSTREDGRKIVVPETQYASHIKEILEKIKVESTASE